MVFSSTREVRYRNLKVPSTKSGELQTLLKRVREILSSKELPHLEKKKGDPEKGIPPGNDDFTKRRKKQKKRRPRTPFSQENGSTTRRGHRVNFLRETRVKKKSTRPDYTKGGRKNKKSKENCSLPKISHPEKVNLTGRTHPDPMLKMEEKDALARRDQINLILKRGSLYLAIQKQKEKTFPTRGSPVRRASKISSKGPLEDTGGKRRGYRRGDF